MKNIYLYLIVFVAGAAVLAVEILGTRILGPFYGVSLFSLISNVRLKQFVNDKKIDAF